MTNDQVWIGISLALALAVGCQIVGSKCASRPCFAGLGLNLSKLKGHTRTVVVRLLLLGVPLTWVVATLVSGPLFDMAHGAAVMFGAILVVSGPTVVGPLLGSSGRRIGAPGAGLGGSLIAEASSPDVEIECVTEILLLTSEHTFNSVATEILRGGESGRVYRIGSRKNAEPGHWSAPNRALERDGDTILFHPDLTDDAMIRRRSAVAVAEGDGVPPDHKLPSRVRRNGELVAVTTRTTPQPRARDSVVLCGPISTVPQALTASPEPGSA